jgi:hypothetical protein
MGQYPLFSVETRQSASFDFPPLYALPQAGVPAANRAVSVVLPPFQQDHRLLPSSIELATATPADSVKSHPFSESDVFGERLTGVIAVEKQQNYPALLTSDEFVV